MFCNNCGTQFPDDTAFCPNCGAAAAGAAPADATNDAPAAPAKKPPIAIIACVLAAILLIVCLASCFTGSAKSVAKKYVKASLEGNFSKSLSCSLYSKSVLEKMIKAEAKEEDMSVKEAYEQLGSLLGEDNIKNMNGFIKAASKKTKESMKDTYGKYSVSVKVTDAEKMDKDDLKELKDDIKDSDFKKYIKASKISKGYEVEVEYKIKGKDDDTEGTATVYLVKYGMSWKVVKADGVNNFSLFN